MKHFKKERRHHQHGVGHGVRRQSAPARLFINERCDHFVHASLIQALAEKGIRVKGVAPRTNWTPLIPSAYPAKKVEISGSDVPLECPGQPEEIAPRFVFLASGTGGDVIPYLCLDRICLALAQHQLPNSAACRNSL